MTTIPNIPAGKLGVLLDPKREMITALTAVLALRGPVRVLAGSNYFDAYKLARQLRRQTPHLEAALNRITIARAFTSYQVLALLTQTPATAVPTLALDLLTTFTDESVNVVECFRLWRLVIGHLNRLREQAPVVVSLRYPPQPNRSGLVTLLTETADIVLERDPEPVIFTPRLF